MEYLENIGIYALIVTAALFGFAVVIPRQKLLKVRWESIPESISQPGGFYRHIYQFPFWILNKFGKFMLISTCITGAVDLFLLGAVAVVD